MRAGTLSKVLDSRGQSAQFFRVFLIMYENVCNLLGI
ncbi:hypothetical protein Mal15_56730 [Stieleria maiorica]|uniref:Uncharacterized protein n=1 Tax=Stieleria maiorica TaxID=2795974 RepID=A0A5B9MPJ1_9BACT|nr:hypothetical protein Mal15_56730 [Stieleria maiorica]